MYSKRAGFTVVEIVVSMAIASLVLIGIMSLFVGLASNSAAVVKTADQIRNNDTAINTIDKDLRMTKTFLATNSVADSNSTASPIGASGWKFGGSGDNNRILILQTYATTSATQDDNRQIVYYDDGAGGCPIGRFPAYNNVIYFLKDNTLYRRVLVEATVPTGKTYCGANPTNPANTISQKQTCANPTASTTDNCANLDVAVAKNISRFKVDYYQNPADASVLDSVYTLSDTDATATLGTVPTLRISIATRGESADGINELGSYRRLSKGTIRGF